jgi:cobalamin biosynthesis Mg chelatase CobN
VFGFALSAPASAGTATFPVAQIYDTGENVLWSSSAQLQVTSGQAPTTSAPQPSPSPTTPNGPPTTTAQSESSNAGSGTDGGSSASTALSPDSSNAVTLQADQTEDLVGAHSTSTSDDAPILGIVVAVIVVIIVGGAAFALARRRGR